MGESAQVSQVFSITNFQLQSTSKSARPAQTIPCAAPSSANHSGSCCGRSPSRSWTEGACGSEQTKMKPAKVSTRSGCIRSESVSKSSTGSVPGAHSSWPSTS